MGASESFPATPTFTPLFNKHLRHVSDPRSPTAGILRTPIEVESSPKESITSFPKEDSLVDKNQNENWDPRSPTPGISRTPLKDLVADILNYPPKQLCENFLEESTEELSLEESQRLDQKSEVTFVMGDGTSGNTVSSGELFPESFLQAEAGGNEQLPSIMSTAAAARPIYTSRIFHPTENKSAKRRVGKKMLVMSTGTGRSPLSVLQEDNSPLSLSYQSKRSLSATDDQAEPKDGRLSSGQNLTAGSCSWDSINKENQQCRWVEN